MTDNPTIEVSEAARRLKALREQSGLSMRSVAEALGWALTRYQHYEDRYKRPFLPADLAYALAEIFKAEGIDPASVLELAGIGTAPAASAGGTSPLRLASVAPSPGPARDLPVLGAVKGGSEGFYFNEGEPKEFLLRPANLAGATDAFALYVYGDSMEPRYFAGEILYVNPNRPLTRNCFVAVELSDGQGMIKQFVSRSDDYVLLRQFNPRKDIRLPAREVRRIYRITGSGEPG
ncbi:LexA family transcriptional regulator [Rhodospirillaceae bacterium SYSU D60014]|uniref:LexA family transcriptional regulator n=1 Tax=Virgifigura deserti TaxID=2268457 RepID=UPI000E660C64